MKAATLFSLVALVAASVIVAAASVSGCEDPLSAPCPIPGDTYWLCKFSVQRRGCGCWAPMEVSEWACANNPGTASEKAEMIVGVEPGLIVLASKGCVDTGTRYPHAIQPELTVQTIPPPSCDLDMAENACVTCAKGYCCAEYQTCFEDLNCICWVQCLAGGSAPDVCAATENCGPPESTATSTAACLNAYCKTDCVTMGDPCACDSNGSSASSGGSP